MNYYELFEIDAQPIVAASLVASKYIALQKKYHPDYFTQELENEQADALEMSAHINKAYNIFKNEDKSLAYFLEHHQIITTDEKFNLPQDFLMEVMELNETLEDDTDTTKKIDQFKANLNAGVKELLTTNKTVYTTEELAQLKTYFYQKKYLQRILERLAD
jgi:molecular chaperone HscB